jgi:thiol peroxidase
MATIKLAGENIETSGNLPETGTIAPDFYLTGTDMLEASLTDYSGKNVVLNIFPSIDTSVCAASVRRFNKEMSELTDTVVLCVSADLPFAHKRFCEIEGLNNVIPLSVFRNQDFGQDYGVTITSGPLKGLLARAIVIINQQRKIIYTEQVPEIKQDPDFDRALSALQEL